MDALQNIILGVIGSLIAAFIFEVWRNNSDWFPGPSTPPVRYQKNSENSDPRRRNREKFSLAIFNGFFYFYTFFLVYQALSLPVILRAFFSKQDVYLSQARFIGEFLPDALITKDTVQATLVALTFVVYVLIYLLVNLVAGILAPVVDKFWAVNIYLWRRLQTLIFVFFAAGLAVVSIWMFYPVTLTQALANFFTVVAIGALFAMSRR